MSDSEGMLRAEHVSRVYTTASGVVNALQDVSLEIRKGTLVGLKGRSGSGKTTLLNVLGGLDQPTSGQVVFDGTPLHVFNDEALTHLRCMHMGFIFQSFALLPTYSAVENVEFALRLAGRPVRESQARALQCLKAVGLANRRNSRPDELSGGQQQRVAIARAMANHPTLILADEPTGELDTKTTRQVLSLLRQLVDRDGVTILLTSHDPIVDEYAQDVYTLEDGRLLASESVP